MSVLASTSLGERICSGDMYSGEPIIAPVRVNDPARSRRSGRAIFEMPKSSTLIDELPVGAPDAEEVRGLQIAVDDAERVGVRDGDAGLEHELDRLVDRQGATLLEHRRRGRPPPGTP